MSRSFFSILAGYVVLYIVQMLGFGIVSAACGVPLGPDGIMIVPPMKYMIGTLAAAVVGAMAGGFVTASLARHVRSRHAAMMGLLYLTFGVAYGLQNRDGPQPVWYLITLPVLGALGAAAGGLLKEDDSGRSDFGAAL